MTEGLPVAMDRAEAAAHLGVDPEASPREIQVAFRRLVMNVHPDRAQGRGETPNGADLGLLARARDVLLAPRLPWQDD